MQEVFRAIGRLSHSNITVLINGESGTGKELVAHALHRHSPRAASPFIALNMAAIPKDLMESELFGHEKGAFTGAANLRRGRFEQADGGTLFLDEIGNLPLAGQMKLLRVLETGRFERLGSNREWQVSVRVISATNADLPALIRDGNFREDLFYRLNAIELSLPPLAERPGDILPLAESFRPKDKPIGESARTALLRHAWPGNVRELRNVIQRAGLLATGDRIEAADLNLPKASVSKPAATQEPDRATIESALARAGGVIAQAAAELGLSRQALYRRMDRFGIKLP